MLDYVVYRYTYRDNELPPVVGMVITCIRDNGARITRSVVSFALGHHLMSQLWQRYPSLPIHHNPF
jgi:hypothetical protein